MIINFLNSEGCCLVRCGHVIEDLRIAAKDFKFIYFSHVRCTGNSVAQHLAKKEKVWLEEMSKDISPFVTHDKLLIQ